MYENALVVLFRLMSCAARRRAARGPLRRPRSVVGRRELRIREREGEVDRSERTEIAHDGPALLAGRASERGDAPSASFSRAGDEHDLVLLEPEAETGVCELEPAVEVGLHVVDDALPG